MQMQDSAYDISNNTTKHITKRSQRNGQYKRLQPKRIQYNLNRKWKKKEKKVIQPTICKETFTVEEDQKIIDLVLQMGPKFVKIAPFFPGKTYSMVKNRYYKHLRETHSSLLQSSLGAQKPTKIREELNSLLNEINFSPDILAITQNMLKSLTSYF